MNVTSVLDIGVGHGKAGVLIREYLEIMNLRYKRSEWQGKVFGIEAFSGYQNDLWNYAYDRVVVADAINGIQEFQNIDLIIALDVWEHFEPNYEKIFRQACLERARWLLISTPKKPLSQKNVFNNSYERHLSKWSPENFHEIPYRLVTCTKNDWIILLSSCEPIPSCVKHFAYPSEHLLNGLFEAIDLWKLRFRFRI